jgi:hypothetical protein
MSCNITIFICRTQSLDLGFLGQHNLSDEKNGIINNVALKGYSSTRENLLEI